MPSFRFRSCVLHLCYFDPRTWLEVRHLFLVHGKIRTYFNPRTFCDVRYSFCNVFCLLFGISIHAPSERCEIWCSLQASGFRGIFRSAHVLWRAIAINKIGDNYFVISIRALMWSAIISSTVSNILYISIRAPLLGATIRIICIHWVSSISIRAPLLGAILEREWIWFVVSNFDPRTPCRCDYE